MAKMVAELTDNKFQIQSLRGRRDRARPAGARFRLRAGRSSGPDRFLLLLRQGPDFALATVVPFGLNTRQMNAWVTQGGGEQLINDFLKTFNVIGMVGGNTTAQMGGWFRKEIKTVDDLKGLKMRIAGLAGDVMTKLGVVPQQIAGGGNYPALEKGTVDAAESVGLYDDQKLGFVKVAPYYYYPGWWEGNAALHLIVSINKFNALPKAYQQILRMAAAETNNFITTRYDADNPTALRALIATGAKLQPFSQQILEASFVASTDVRPASSQRTPTSRRSTIRRWPSARTACCGHASPRTPTTISWRANRLPTSSDARSIEGRKAPQLRGFSLLSGHRAMCRNSAPLQDRRSAAAVLFCESSRQMAG